MPAPPLGRSRVLVAMSADAARVIAATELRGPARYAAFHHPGERTRTFHQAADVIRQNLQPTFDQATRR